jgi:hypothetical protein
MTDDQMSIRTSVVRLKCDPQPECIRVTKQARNWRSDNPIHAHSLSDLLELLLGVTDQRIDETHRQVRRGDSITPIPRDYTFRELTEELASSELVCNLSRPLILAD